MNTTVYARNGNNLTVIFIIIQVPNFTNFAMIQNFPRRYILHQTNESTWSELL